MGRIIDHMDKKEELFLLEQLMRASDSLSDQTRNLAVSILSGGLPGIESGTAIPVSRPEYSDMHEAFHYILLNDYGVSVPPHVAIVERVIRPPRMWKKYRTLLIEATDIVGGILDEAHNLGVAYDASEEAKRIHLSRLLVRYGIWYVHERKPADVPIALPVITNILCPALEYGSYDQWNEAVGEYLPSYLHGGPEVRKIVLDRWLNPATPEEIGAEM